jgi:putative transposase
VTRSSVYTEPKQPDPKAVELRETIMKEIDVIHTKEPALGQRKILKRLRKAGYTIGRKLVRRLMQEMGLHTVYPKVNLSKRNFKEAIVPYLLRNVSVQFPNQVWSIDITYIRMEHGHMYLAAVIDWFSRKIVGWDLSDTLDTSVLTH